jgi:hypothetical protein
LIVWLRAPIAGLFSQAARQRVKMINMRNTFALMFVLLGTQYASAQTDIAFSCDAFSSLAAMGATGYASLSAAHTDPGSANDVFGKLPAKISIGGSQCDVTDNYDTLLCKWRGSSVRDYNTLAGYFGKCFADSKINAAGGVTTIWYGGVPAVTMISIASDDSNMTLEFNGRSANRYSLSR